MCVWICVCVLSGVHLTGQHGENGGEGVQFESVDDVAGVKKLQTHQTEADHQQQDVEHLGHHRQPQNTCTHTHTNIHRDTDIVSIYMYITRASNLPQAAVKSSYYYLTTFFMWR